MHNFFLFQITNANETATISIQTDVIIFVANRSADKAVLNDMMGMNDGMDTLILLAQTECGTMDDMDFYRIYA